MQKNGEGRTYIEAEKEKKRQKNQKLAHDTPAVYITDRLLREQEKNDAAVAAAQKQSPSNQ